MVILSIIMVFVARLNKIYTLVLVITLSLVRVRESLVTKEPTDQ